MCDGVSTKVMFKFSSCSRIWTFINRFGLAVDLPTRIDSRTLSESLNITMDGLLLIVLTISVIYSNEISIATISPVYIDILLVSLLLISTFNSGIQNVAETMPSGVLKESMNTFI